MIRRSKQWGYNGYQDLPKQRGRGKREEPGRLLLSRLDFRSRHQCGTVIQMSRCRTHMCYQNRVCLFVAAKPYEHCRHGSSHFSSFIGPTRRPEAGGFRGRGEQGSELHHGAWRNAQPNPTKWRNTKKGISWDKAVHQN